MDQTNELTGLGFNERCSHSHDLRTCTGTPVAGHALVGQFVFERECYIKTVGYQVQERWAAKATELNRHTTRMKIRGSVVS